MGQNTGKMNNGTLPIDQEMLKESLMELEKAKYQDEHGNNNFASEFEHDHAKAIDPNQKPHSYSHPTSKETYEQPLKDKENTDGNVIENKEENKSKDSGLKSPIRSPKLKARFGKLMSPRLPPSPPASPQLNKVAKREAEFPKPLHDRFEISEKVIGEGAFSKIRLGSNLTTNQKVAVKSFMKSKNMSKEQKEDLEMIYREKKILQAISHPNIVKLYAVQEDDCNVHLFLQYIEGGDMYTYVCENGRISEKNGRNLFQQMISSIEYCHSNGICHRDVKLENFLIDKQCHIYLIDFGFASLIPPGGIFSDYPGSPAYACPSILMGQPYDGKSADIYALGIVLYTMHYAAYPFYHENTVTMCRMICEAQATFKDDLSPEIIDLMKSMMRKRGSARPSMDEVKTHRWLSAVRKRSNTLGSPNSAFKLKSLV